MVLCLFAGFVASSNGASELLLPDAKITVKVVNEAGIPVADADVGVGFNQGGNTWIGEHKSESIRGVSDTNGLFSAQEKCMGGIGISVQKEGFYRSSVRQDYPGTYQNKKRWEPWNPTISMILKEIKTPIPMYVKAVRTVIPETDKTIGFDLEKGDWVAPYGNGIVSDFIFYATNRQRSVRDFDYTLLLTFPNEADGIQAADSQNLHKESELKLDYHSPEDGYISRWEQFRSRRPKKGETNNIDRDRKYYFRVRTKVDEHGNIISAHYGKIHGDFLQFTCYFNPVPNDRNIEFDPDKNLFEGRDRFAP